MQRMTLIGRMGGVYCLRGNDAVYLTAVDQLQRWDKFNSLKNN